MSEPFMSRIEVSHVAYRALRSVSQALGHVWEDEGARRTERGWSILISPKTWLMIAEYCDPLDADEVSRLVCQFSSRFKDRLEKGELAEAADDYEE